MTQDERTVRVGAVAAGLSALMLVLMALVAFPNGEFYPAVSVLAGAPAPAADVLMEYQRALGLLFTLDGVFLAGWLLAWIGLYRVIRKRHLVYAVLSLGFGLAGAVLDFGENSLIWGAAGSLAAGQTLAPGWLQTWKAVQHLSYWFPYIAAVFAALSVWSGRALDRIISLIGTVLVVAAAAGLYFPAFSLVSNVWFLVWFVGLSVWLWRAAPGH